MSKIPYVLVLVSGVSLLAAGCAASTVAEDDGGPDAYVRVDADVPERDGGPADDAADAADGMVPEDDATTPDAGPEPDDGGSAQPDADVPPDGEATLTLEPYVVANGIIPSDDVVLLASRPLDASTIEGNVELRVPTTTETVPATLTYVPELDAIVIDPARVLWAGTSYTIVVRGVRAVDGAEVHAREPHVRVRGNAPEHSFTRYDASGEMDVIVVTHRIAGQPGTLRRTTATGPGPDGVWLTLDDELDGYEVITRDALEEPRLETRMRFGGAGANGTWLDDDDDFERAYRTVYGEDGLTRESLHSEDPGADAELFSPDDAYVSVGFWTYEDVLLRRSLYASFATPGPDGTWLTGDDEITSHHRYDHDGDARLVRQRTFDGPGPDGAWYTDDDILSAYETYAYDTLGRRERRVTFSGPGQNGIWLDEDDDVGTAYVTVHEVGVERRVAIRAGADRRLGTPDDFVLSYVHEAYGSDGRTIAMGTYNGPGPNGVWFDDDDRVDPLFGAYATAYTLEADGGLLEVVGYTEGNGPDGLRFTGDEPLRSRIVRRYSPLESLERYARYDSPGPNGVWGDADDHLDSVMVYTLIGISGR